MLLLLSPSSPEAGLKNFGGASPPSFSMSPETVDLAPSPTWLSEEAFGKDLQTIFLSVAEKIHYEPYRGVLRGAIGTAISASGNSLDQALLLGYLLRQKGYRVRIVRGELSPGNFSVLLRGIYPPDIPEYKIDTSLNPYHPESDSDLSFAGKEHYWIEVDQGESWLPLDPSFPRAKIGEAYARRKDTFNDIPDDLHQFLTITMKQQLASGQIRTILTEKMKLREVGYKPISLLSLRVPQVKPGEDNKNGSDTKKTFGGSLGGGSKKQRKKDVGEKPISSEEIVGAKYQFGLHIPGRGLVERALAINREDKRSWIRKEWLEFELSAPGVPPRVITRNLFDGGKAGWANQPEAYRRYQIGVFPGSVPTRLVESIREKAKKILKGTSRDDLETLSRQGENAPLDKMLSLESKMGQISLHMILLRFAESSDEISDRSAYRTGLAVVRDTPRILISSLIRNQDREGKAKERFNLDLRYDEVSALPFPGFPSTMSRLFHQGRGLQESRVEGGVLQALTGRKSVTAAELFQKAQASSILVLDRKNLRKEGKGLPEKVTASVTESVEKGKIVIIPVQPVTVSGSKRWGWWEVDPETGMTIGVMDDGLHSSMAEYSISSSRVQLNDKMGFVIGGMTGASSTLFVVSAKILEYGQVTDQMIQEVEQYLKSALCFCPKAEASVSASAGVSVSGKAGCFEKEISIGKKAKAGVSLSVGSFCEAFVAGFRCASGMILAGLKGESSAKASVEAKGGIGIKGNFGVSCE